MPDSAVPSPARLVILQPEDGRSFWQPVPANGFVRCLLDQAATGAETPFAFGTQTVDPGCHVREHLHDANEEIIFVIEGEGEAHVEGQVHPMRRNSCFCRKPCSCSCSRIPAITVKTWQTITRLTNCARRASSLAW